MGTVLFVLGILTSSGFAGLNVPLMNCLRGYFSAMVSAVLVLFLDDVIVVDEFALAVWVCTADILIAER